MAIATVGCGNQNGQEQVTTSSSHSLANETIKSDPAADLFIFNDRVYVRNEELDSSQDQLGELLGKIESNYKADEAFKNSMSTVLPIGTEIFRIKGGSSVDRVIIKQEDQLFIYTALIEG